MEAIQIFNNPQFGSIRTAGTADNPLFCLTDVCRVLELQTGATKNRLNQKGISSINTPTNGGNQFLVFINEQNLYKVIMRSDKPQAEPFQDWVCGEVLPSIRKHGAYMTQDTIEKALSSPDFLIQLATELKEERQKRIEAEQEAKDAQPALIFTHAVSGSANSCLIGELAKLISQNGYPMGEKRLFKWMRDNGYLGTRGERYNIPNQRYIDMGLFELKKGVRTGNGGVLHTTITTKVTGRGQIYFVNKFNKIESA
jgi:putative antirepressor